MQNLQTKKLFDFLTWLQEVKGWQVQEHLNAIFEIDTELQRLHNNRYKTLAAKLLCIELDNYNYLVLDEIARKPLSSFVSARADILTPHSVRIKSRENDVKRTEENVLTAINELTNILVDGGRS